MKIFLFLLVALCFSFQVFSTTQSSKSNMNQTKVVLITGVTKGLGYALARQFAESGWRVVGCGRSIDAIQQMQKEFGADHFFTAVDITDDHAVLEWSQSVLAKVGPPNILINNAALINRPAPLADLTPAEFSSVLSANVMGTFNVIRYFIPEMIKRGSGLIVNMSSGWGRHGGATMSPYCASKFAVEGLTQSLAKELPSGMAVVTLDPGAINTDMLRSITETASQYPTAEQKAKIAVPFILKLTTQDNGKALSLS